MLFREKQRETVSSTQKEKNHTNRVFVKVVSRGENRVLKNKEETYKFTKHIYDYLFKTFYEIQTFRLSYINNENAYIFRNNKL